VTSTGRVAVAREPDDLETSMCDQRSGEGDRHSPGPHAFIPTFGRPDDSRREVDPHCEADHRGKDGYHAGATSARNLEPEKRDVSPS